MRREDWDARYTEKDFVWTVEPNRFLVAEVSDLPPGRALDLACGEGRNAVWLAARGWRVTGVDFSCVAIEKAEALAAHRGVAVHWQVADLEVYEQAARSFDLVVVLYLQMQAAKLQPVLSRAAAGVAPGGTLLVVSHDVLNLSEGHGGPKDAAVLTTPEGVSSALTGLDIERAERVERPVEGADRPAIDTLVRASRPAARNAARV
jgi:SAM-dependent methyltransferase